MKDDISIFIADEEIGIVEAMKLIDKNSKGILYIAKNGKLAGSLTDGDIRRYIIKGGEISSLARQAMNCNTKYVTEADISNAPALMKKFFIYSVPVIDDDRRIVDIVFSEARKGIRDKTDALKDTPVIIMAGGKGTRLYPYTKILPKPLIPIGEVPILERIMNRFADFGVRDFILTLNYKKEIIKSYFNELSPDYGITYVEEDKPLGTAGSIRLIKKQFDSPVIITNCDIIINTDYEKILESHISSGNAMTIVSSLKNIAIPYGVLHSSEDGSVLSMEEKPKLSYLINTGMYVLDPRYIDIIPKNEPYDMPALAQQLIGMGLRVGMYPISESAFLDMGEFEEMKKMEERISRGDSV